MMPHLFLIVIVAALFFKCDGFQCSTTITSSSAHRVKPLFNNREASTLQQDEAIQELMKTHDPILLFASRLLDADTARDASALYAWCRRLVSFLCTYN